jgi:hypothetical protein
MAKCGRNCDIRKTVPRGVPHGGPSSGSVCPHRTTIASPSETTREDRFEFRAAVTGRLPVSPERRDEARVFFLRTLARRSRAIRDLRARCVPDGLRGTPDWREDVWPPPRKEHLPSHWSTLVPLRRSDVAGREALARRTRNATEWAALWNLDAEWVVLWADYALRRWGFASAWRDVRGLSDDEYRPAPRPPL